jgi:hypothetical protein
VVIDNAVKALRQFQSDYSGLMPEKAQSWGMDKKFIEDNKDKLGYKGGEIADAAENLAGLITTCKNNCLNLTEMASTASQLLQYSSNWPHWPTWLIQVQELYSRSQDQWAWCCRPCWASVQIPHHRSLQK